MGVFPPQKKSLPHCSLLTAHMIALPLLHCGIFSKKNEFHHLFDEYTDFCLEAGYLPILFGQSIKRTKNL